MPSRGALERPRQREPRERLIGPTREHVHDVAVEPEDRWSTRCAAATQSIPLLTPAGIGRRV
eukprot:scaffold4600_cov74-Phaeocystis_antarctica.AAC.5